MGQVAGQPLISDELGGFLESGLSINVGTRDGKLQPDGAIAWAVRVHDDRAHLTLFMHKEAAQAMLKNLRAHPEIAVTFDLPTSHRACQVKGRFVSTRPAKAAERTPDAKPSANGPEWVAITPPIIDRFAGDRIASWFEFAVREAGD
jgi:hypothetical protein